MDEISVRAPATVANVVCGFDCLGFAASAPFDEMTIRKIEEKTVRIVHLDAYNLPLKPEQNVAGKALLSMLERTNKNFGFEIEITKHIKPGSGIGSSAASAAGAVAAANVLLNNQFSTLELIEMALDGEQIASGARHADNVAPCLLGGFTLIRSLNPLDVVKIECPPLFATIIHPQIEIKTSEARSILPTEVPLKDAIRQWSNLGAFVAGMQTGDYQLIARSMEDFIVEPVRKKLIPRFDEVKSESLSAGALGGGISGSGPSIFMLSETIEIAQKVENAMRRVYSETPIDFNIYVTEINANGVMILEK